MEKRSIHFLDYLALLVKWRKYMIINSLLVCLAVAALSLCLPKWFTSGTTILPPVSESAGLGLSALMQQVPFGLGNIGLGGVTEETSLVLAILQSRTMMESVVDEFDLMKEYKAKDSEEAVRTLRSRVKVKINDEGTISLNVKAKTKWFTGKEQSDAARTLAMNMANYFIAELDELNKNFKTAKARNNRIFIEKRYLQNLDDLQKAEVDLADFQKKYGVIALPEQTAAAIEAAAELQASIILKEIEIGVMRESMGETHQDVIRARTELRELQNKLNSMRTGIDDSDIIIKNEEDWKSLFLPFKDVPDLGMEYLRLFRELTLQEKLMEFLLPEYEQAKIAEARDTPTLQVLDPAVRPIKRTSPKRAFMVVAAGFLSIFFFAMVVYVSINIEHVKLTDEQRYAQIVHILQQSNPKRWFR